MACDLKSVLASHDLQDTSTSAPRDNRDILLGRRHRSPKKSSPLDMSEESFSGGYDFFRKQKAIEDSNFSLYPTLTSNMIECPPDCRRAKFIIDRSSFSWFRNIR